jgi:metal-responsive CopG/Arc/MetJ family transcriptional regulator
MRPKLSDTELGRVERERRRCKLGVRLPLELIIKIERRAKRLGISRNKVLNAIVRAALEADTPGRRKEGMR